MKGESKYHPILFSGEMVNAILEGRKTMTRRICKGARELSCGYRLHLVEWLHYPLNKIVRGIKENMDVVWLTIGSVLVPLGFSILFAGMTMKN